VFTASVKHTVTAAGSEAVSLTLAPAYNAINGGRFDLVDALAMATEIDIPFGGVESATLLYVRNMSGQELEVTLNVAALLYNLPHGATLQIASETMPDAQPLSACMLKTTAAIDGADRYVEYRVAGDPVAP